MAITSPPAEPPGAVRGAADGIHPCRGRPTAASLSRCVRSCVRSDRRLMLDAVENRYLLRPAGEPDLPLLSRWRALPHVSRWWGDPAIEAEIEKLRERRIAMWIAEFEGRPFAFIQDYDIRAWSPHHFDYLPPGSRGMDVYIGEPAMLGSGHGSRLVRQHVDRLFTLGSPAVGIDPHPDNAAALRAFEKAGFSITSGPLDTRWSRGILMHRFA